MATQLQGGNAPCLAATPLDPYSTVLAFDSGVGGLSVYDETRRFLPDLHYIYTFDNVAFPYGEKSEELIVERIVEIMTVTQQCYPLSLMVIAYNTAGTVSLPALRERFTFPVVGVVPVTKPVARLTAGDIVGLLTTRAMVKRSYAHELVTRLANECQVATLGPAELAELAEARLRGETVPLKELRRILRPWLRMSESPDTAALGCTHSPLLQEEPLQVLSEGTRLVSSDAMIACHTVWLLEHEAPDTKSIDENVASYMAMTIEAEQLLSVLQRYDFKTLGKLSV